MNYSEHFDQIVNFIRPNQEIWNNEILDLIPNRLNLFNKDWVKDLNSLSLEDLWQVDCFQKTELLPEGDFKNWLTQLSSLCALPKYDYKELEVLPDWAFMNVKFKKKHEILIISNLLKEIRQTHPFAHLVDIGGGVGNLSRVMAHYKNIECISLDINEEFQRLGRIKLTKSRPPSPDFKNVTFINHDFTNSLNQELTNKIFSKDSFSLGLHTCGPLAVAHIKVATENNTQGFVNFGCCYYRLKESDLNLSLKAKENGFKLGTYACSLAARGHSSMDYEGFLLKKRVKDFRYSIHLLMSEHLKIENIISVGEGDSSEYWGKFSDYVLKRFTKLKIEHTFSAEFLDTFFEDEKLQSYLHELYLCNVIRWQFGRALELYILLDRCLYLQEQGFLPRLLEFFDSNLSPRNIGLLVLSNS